MVGYKLTGVVNSYATSTDVVLTITKVHMYFDNAVLCTSNLLCLNCYMCNSVQSAELPSELVEHLFHRTNGQKCVPGMRYW